MFRSTRWSSTLLIAWGIFWLRAVGWSFGKLYRTIPCITIVIYWVRKSCRLPERAMCRFCTIVWILSSHRLLSTMINICLRLFGPWSKLLTNACKITTMTKAEKYLLSSASSKFTNWTCIGFVLFGQNSALVFSVLPPQRCFISGFQLWVC